MIMLIMVAICILFTLSFQQNQIEIGFLSELTPLVFLVIGLVTGFGIFYEISTYVTHLFGMLSDAVVFVYSIDCEVERVHYRRIGPNSLPEGLMEVFR